LEEQLGSNALIVFSVSFNPRFLLSMAGSLAASLFLTRIGSKSPAELLATRMWVFCLGDGERCFEQACCGAACCLSSQPSNPREVSLDLSIVSWSASKRLRRLNAGGFSDRAVRRLHEPTSESCLLAYVSAVLRLSPALRCDCGNFLSTVLACGESFNSVFLTSGTLSFLCCSCGELFRSTLLTSGVRLRRGCNCGELFRSTVLSFALLPQTCCTFGDPIPSTDPALDLPRRQRRNCGELFLSTFLASELVFRPRCFFGERSPSNLLKVGVVPKL